MIRRGLTLIELMVALTITGLALLGARYITHSLDDAGRSLAAFGERTDRTANGNRLLRALFSRAEVTADSLRRFRGDTATASFDTWCESGGGWLERCRVAVTLGTGQDSSTVTGVLPGGVVLHLATLSGTAVFRYVTRDSGGVRRLDYWGRSVTAPFAVIIESVADTLVLIVGDRG